MNLANLPVRLLDTPDTLCASLCSHSQYATYLECPASLLTGVTSAGSSASVNRVKSLGTSHIKILPSSEPEAMIRSLKGCQSVSNTTAVCPRKRGTTSGIFPFSFSGITANAPPPPDSQLTARYSGLTETKLVSQAFLLMWRLS